MSYLKIILSSIVAMVIAAVVIWSGLFIILFSAIATPLLAWWLKKRSSNIETPSQTNATNEKKSGNEPDFKIIDAKYEIIEK